MSRSSYTSTLRGANHQTQCVYSKNVLQDYDLKKIKIRGTMTTLWKKHPSTTTKVVLLKKYYRKVQEIEKYE